MTSGQQNTASRLAYANDVAGSWGAENAILTNQEFLDAVCSTNLCDELGDLGVPVATVAANDKEGSVSALGDRLQNAGDEGL